MITNKNVELLRQTLVTKEDLQKNTDLLIELVTGCFKRMYQTLKVIQQMQKVQNNHRRRLDIIEEKVFA